MRVIEREREVPYSNPRRYRYFVLSGVYIKCIMSVLAERNAFTRVKTRTSIVFGHCSRSL